MQLSTKHLFIILALVLFLLPWLIHGLVWPEIIATQLGHCPKQNCDFLNHYLPQAQRLHNGDPQLQEGWFYPPTLAILIEGFLFCPQNWISSLWTTSNLLIMLFLAFLGVQINETTVSKPTKILWSLALISTSFPVLSSIKWGQVSLCLILISWWALHHKKGWLLGVAGALKGYPMVYLLWPLLNKNLRFFSRSLGSFLCIGLLIPVLRLGIDQSIIHYQNMFSAGQWIQYIAPIRGGQALAPSMHRFFIDGTHMMDTSPALIFPIPEMGFHLLFLGILTGILVATCLLIKKSSVPLVLLFCAVGLLMTPGWQHYFCFLPLCHIRLWKDAVLWQRVSIILLVLIERIPVIFLGVIPHIYYDFSAYSGTFVVTFLTFLLALAHPKRSL